MDKTLLLTGATGFVGQHADVALRKAGWNVLCGVRCPRRYKGASDCVRFDLDDPSEILALEKRIRPSAIVHLACHVGWDGSDVARMFVPNVLAVACIACLARSWNAKLVFSSAAILHGIKTESIDEKSPIRADSPYAQTKLLAENMIEAAGIEFTILRIAGIFGRQGPEHLGLNRSIEAALRGTAPTLIGSGAAKRNYIYVKDVAQTIVFALNANVRGVHLLGGREVCSIKEMLSAICEVLAPGLEPESKPGGEASNQVVHPSRELPKGRSFRDALADISTGTPICD